MKNRILARILKLSDDELNKNVDNQPEENQNVENNGTDWTNLDDEKVFNTYKEKFESYSGPLEDSSGQLDDQDPVFNRLHQTTDYVNNIINKRLSEYDSLPDPEVPDNIRYMEVGEEGETLEEMQEKDPMKVNVQNEKWPKDDYMTPYKVTALVTKNKLGLLENMEKEFKDEIMYLTELADYASQRNSFLERFFGLGEVKRRQKHYRELMNTWQKGIDEAIKRTKIATGNLARIFHKINSKGKELFPPGTFDFAKKKGKQFVKNLSLMANQNNISISRVNSYLWNSILAGEGLSSNRSQYGNKNLKMKRLAFKNRLRKIIASFDVKVLGWEPYQNTILFDVTVPGKTEEDIDNGWNLEYSFAIKKAITEFIKENYDKNKNLANTLYQMTKENIEQIRHFQDLHDQANYKDVEDLLDRSNITDLFEINFVEVKNYAPDNIGLVPPGV